MRQVLRTLLYKIVSIKILCPTYEAPTNIIKIVVFLKHYIALDKRRPRPQDLSVKSHLPCFGAGCCCDYYTRWLLRLDLLMYLNNGK